MKLASIIVVIALCALANFGPVHAPPPVGPGYVYLALELNPHGGLTNYFKVGGTGDPNPNNKRSKLNTGNPRHLEILEMFPVHATQAAENAAHAALAHWHVKNGGGREWHYVPPAQLDDFINVYLAATHPFAG